MRYYSSVAVESALVGSLTASAATMSVSTVVGLPINYPFTLTIEPGDVAAEIVSVTAAAGTTLTVVRAQDGTSGVTHSVGAVVRHDHSARDFRESRDHEAATTAVHGATGAVVGSSDTQTLTNKNLAGAGNVFPASLVTLTGTQVLTNKILTDASNVFPVPEVTLAGMQTLTFKNLASTTNTFPASLATVTGYQALTNKILTDPSNVFPASLVGTAATQSLTNKNLTSATNTFPASLMRTTDVQAGTSTVPAGIGGATVTRAVVFPTAFTSTPTIGITMETGVSMTSPGIDSYAVTARSTTGFTLTYARMSAWATFNFMWIAVA